MSMIFIEASEAREGTRLPRAVIESARVVRNLEAYTGADMLISPLSEPPMPDELTDSKPRQLSLRKHCEAGLLIQRKSGRDLTNSIRDGHLTNEVLSRMLQWTSAPWLLIEGNFLRDREGMVVVDGYTTNTMWSQLQGAMEAWQLRGGYMTTPPLPTESAVTEWVARWNSTKIYMWRKDMVLPPRKTQQVLVGAMVNEKPWRTTLASFPGIGPEKANDIADVCDNLWQAIQMLTDPKTLVWDKRPKGIGKTTIRNIQAYLGLPEGTIFCPINDNITVSDDGQNVAVLIDVPIVVPADNPPWDEATNKSSPTDDDQDLMPF
jgi:hypothetical protein